MKKIVLFGIIFGIMLTSVADAESQPKGRRIVGGYESTPHAYPWMAALVDPDDRTLYKGVFCGGSLIHSRWILTAAHCAKDDDGKTLRPRQMKAVLNIHNLKTESGDQVMAKRIIVHPLYDFWGSNDYDIALIELERDMPYQTVGWINDDRDLTGEDTLVIGWGYTNKYYPETLMEVHIPIVSNSLCNDTYNKEGGYGENPVTERMICAGADGKDSCAGDSGSPMLVKDGDTWKLAGMVSWGSNPCAEKGLYGVYTRVPALKELIGNYVPAPLEAPTTSLTVSGTTINYSWKSVPLADGYLLSYAPYPDADYIASADMGKETHFSAELWKGAAFYAAVQAYNSSGTSPYSKIDFFVISK